MLSDTGGVKPLIPYHFVRYNICTTFLNSPRFLLSSILLAIFMTGWSIFFLCFFSFFEKDIFCMLGKYKEVVSVNSTKKDYYVSQKKKKIIIVK